MHSLTKPQRKNRIYQRFNEKFSTSPESILNPIERSFKLSQVLEEFLPYYFNNKADKTNQLNTLFQSFQQRVLPELKATKIAAMNEEKNIYQMFDAPALSAANAITRTFSTKLGLFWEEVANLSPNVISSELDFDIKLVGVDSIILYNNNIYYAQLKTQKNTLTGSQVPRAIEELGTYENSWIVACINNNCSWTYNGRIPRLVGNEFWNKINISYDDILQNLGQTVNFVETLL